MLGSSPFSLDSLRSPQLTVFDVGREVTNVSVRKQLSFAVAEDAGGDPAGVDVLGATGPEEAVRVALRSRLSERDLESCMQHMASFFSKRKNVPCPGADEHKADADTVNSMRAQIEQLNRALDEKQTTINAMVNELSYLQQLLLSKKKNRVRRRRRKAKTAQPVSK